MDDNADEEMEDEDGTGNEGELFSKFFACKSNEALLINIFLRELQSYIVFKNLGIETHFQSYSCLTQYRFGGIS